MDYIKWLGEKKLIVWGAGGYGKYLCDLFGILGIFPEYFIDSDPDKSSVTGVWDDRVYQVYRPDRLKAPGIKDAHIIVGVKESRGIEEFLRSCGFVENRDYILYKQHRATANAIHAALYEGPRFKKMAREGKLFRSIEIETVNRCNNDCPFCPANRDADIREKAVMSDGLLESILGQLRDLNYSGTISLFSNNEPLLDKKLIERVKMAKEYLPNACHYLYTNGSLMTIEGFKALMDGLDYMIIDNYSDDKELIPPVVEVAEYVEARPEYKDRLVISRRLKNEVLMTRGGLAPNAVEYRAPACGCVLPFRQFVVRPTGKVSLCCVDAMGKYTLGDLTKQSILEVWDGEAYKKIRLTLMDKGRPALELCKNCDNFSHDFFYENSVGGVWRRD